ncbi:MAG: YbaB/EbfC family nucleoid-associated protein [Labedaea sp.]
MTEPPVDELVARAEQRRQASARLPDIVAAATGVAMDERRLVQATTNASGELKALVLHPAAMSFGGKELRRMIMEAAHQAAEYARQHCFNELALVLGDIATAELEELIGPSPARAAGWDTAPVAPDDRAGAPDEPPASANDDRSDPDDPDDPLSFDPSSLRSDR